MRLAVIALWFCGCVSPCSGGSCEVDASPLVGQEAATDIVWRSHYTEGGSAPLVVWVVRGDCDGGKTFHSPDGNCVDGVFVPESNTAWIMRQDGDLTNRRIEFAHELLHGHFWAHSDSCDPNHTRPEWKYAVDEAAAALVDVWP